MFYTTLALFDNNLDINVSEKKNERTIMNKHVEL